MSAAALFAPVAVFAQPAKTSRRSVVAIVLGPSRASDPIGPARKEWADRLAQHGLQDGRDIEIVILRAEKSLELPDTEALARRAVSTGAAVIILPFFGGHALREYVLPAIGDTPLVLTGPDDRSENTIEAMHRRGLNVTGVMYMYIELVFKRFELMKQMKPSAMRASTVPLLAEFTDPRAAEVAERTASEQTRMFAEMLRPTGLTYVRMPFMRIGQSLDAFVESLRKARIDIVEILYFNSAELWAKLAKAGIAASGVGPGSAERGALLGGWSVGSLEAAARLAAKVIRGERASAVPPERSMEFGLAVNLRTARMLGITVPQSILVLAERVFE